jgi:hypothetical protein
LPPAAALKPKTPLLPGTLFAIPTTASSVELSPLTCDLYVFLFWIA